METNTNRYRSRILREMHQNTKNPFNSPPSSTGSHGTVTLTSDISLGPGADSMPRFEASKRATDDTDDRAMAFNINTSVLGRTFPEWANYKHTGPVHDLTEDLYDATADFPRDETKENIPPASSSTIASPSQIVDDQQRFLHSKTRDARERRESLKATPETPAPAVSAAHKTTTKSRGANVTTLLDNLRTAQEKYGLSQSSKESTPEPAAKATQPSPHNKTSNAARSFLVPDLSIMNDFVSGTLRLSTLRNGVPIFVKNGKVHDREAATTPAKHHAVEAVEVPQDEEEIFVSLDKIREEIGALQEHDAMVSEKAQKLQEEVDELWISLHAQAGPHKNGKGSTEADQALIKQLKQDKNHLQEQLDKANRKIKIVELRAEDSSAAKEAAERERDSAIRDCDRALQTAAQDARRCEQAEDQLASAKRALKDVQDENIHGLGQLESENLRLQQNNESLRAEVQSLEHKLQKQSNDLEKLKVTNQIMSDDLITAKAKHNDKCQSSHTIQLQLEKTADDKAQLENDVRQLEHVRQYFERTNTKLEGDKQTLVEDIVILKEQVAVLQKTTAEQEQEISALHEDISTLQALLDEANNMTEDATDVRSRMESQKRILEQKITSLESAVRRSRANAANSEALFEDVRKQESQLEALNRKLMNENADMQQRLSVAQAELDFGPELPLEDHIDDVVDGLQDGMRRFSGKHTKVLDKQQAQLAEQFLSLIKSEARLTRKRKEGENRPNTSPEDEEEAQQNTVTLTKIREMRTEVVCQMLKGYAGQGKAKPAKVTRIVSPAADATKSYTAETAGRSPTSTTGFPLQDDFTREIDLEQPSPSASRMAPTQRLSQQHKTTAFHGVYAESDDGMTGEPSQSLPPLFFADQPRGNMPKGTDPGRPVRNTTKTQPVGILKNKSAQFDLANDQDTGRFSVKSGVSGMSIFSNASVTNMFQRPTSAIGRSDVDTHEENMTSALFVDDITIDTRKKSNKLQRTKKISAVPVLSKTAQRVLASLCDEHDCGNCNVCMRINSHSHKSVPGQEPKQKIRVSKPIAVTDRIPNSTVTSTAQHEDEHTIRPASNPAVALAAVMKGLKDEEQHIIAVLSKAEKELKSLDASHSRRHRKALKEEVQRLHRELDVKRDQIYMLHDVLEGQKASGEEMTADYVEYTIQSIMGAEETWDGIQA